MSVMVGANNRPLGSIRRGCDDDHISTELMYSRRPCPPIGRRMCCALPLRSRPRQRDSGVKRRRLRLYNNGADSCRTTPSIAGQTVIAFPENFRPHRPAGEAPLAAGMPRPTDRAPPPKTSPGATRRRSDPDIPSARSSSGGQAVSSRPARIYSPSSSASGGLGCFGLRRGRSGRSGRSTTFWRNWPALSDRAIGFRRSLPAAILRLLAIQRPRKR